jgi:hypothetical protein
MRKIYKEFSIERSKPGEDWRVYDPDGNLIVHASTLAEARGVITWWIKAVESGDARWCPECNKPEFK